MRNSESDTPTAAPRAPLEGCVRNLVADLEQLGIADEIREVNGANAVDLLNQYLPQLRLAVADPRG